MPVGSSTVIYVVCDQLHAASPLRELLARQKDDQMWARFPVTSSQWCHVMILGSVNQQEHWEIAGCFLSHKIRIRASLKTRMSLKGMLLVCLLYLGSQPQYVRSSCVGLRRRLGAPFQTHFPIASDDSASEWQLGKLSTPVCLLSWMLQVEFPGILRFLRQMGQYDRWCLFYYLTQQDVSLGLRHDERL